MKTLEKAHKGVLSLGYDTEDAMKAWTEINNQQNQLYGLRTKIENCTSCPLSRNCKPLAGLQFINSDVMIVGEVPSDQDIANGIPFSGTSGFVLTIILNKLGINRNSIYLTNMVKCNKSEGKITLEEAEQCLHHLYNEIAIIKPKVIITLGEAPLRVLSESSTSILNERGNWFTNSTSLNIPVMPTYNPAYLASLKGKELVSAKKQMWSDLKDAFIKAGYLS